MATYQRGSKGPEVKQIQQKLKKLKLYNGEIDGDFGGGTESAVIRFQRTKGLEADGKVGEATWDYLGPPGGKLFSELHHCPNYRDRCK